MHDINFNNSTGKYSFFSAKRTATHVLGKVVTDYPTSAEAIRHAGLDFEVEKVPMFTHWNGQDPTEAGGLPVKTEMPVPDNFATRRADTGQILGVVGNAYHIVQNTDAFSFFDGIVGGETEYCTRPQGPSVRGSVSSLPPNCPVISVWETLRKITPYIIGTKVPLHNNDKDSFLQEN